MDLGGDSMSTRDEARALRDLTYYRKSIMKALCCDEDVVKLVSDDETAIPPNRDLMYENIFPYAYIPDTEKETDTFICFSVAIPRVENKTYKTMNIYFYIFTHQSLMRTSNGLRTDLLAEAIDKMTNGALGLGLGRIKLDRVEDISPTTHYHGLAVQYTVTDFNRPSIQGDVGWFDEE